MLSITPPSNTLFLRPKHSSNSIFLLSHTAISSPSSFLHSQTFNYPFQFPKNPSFSPFFVSKKPSLFRTKSSSESEAEAAEVATTTEDEWLARLPDKKKPLYAHSLPCIEAWLRSLGFRQSNEDRAVWFIEKSEWHAQLSLDITELYIRYLKNRPGNLEKDVERRFSYALSREDIENAVLGGP